MMSVHSLVDKLYELAGCDYLSEIKYPAWRKEVVGIMLSLNGTDYTLEQWTDALCYVTSQDLTFSSLDEVRKFIEEIKASCEIGDESASSYDGL